MKKLLIYGGQFNPIHIGHMLVASETYQYVQPDEFIFLPSYQSPLKEQYHHVDEKDRMKIIQLAIQDLGFGILDDREIVRKGTSYTIDTIREIQQDYQDYQIYFVIGTDQFDHLHKWRNIEQLKEILTFVVVNRNVDEQVVEDNMISVNIPRVDISSTVIRNRCKNRRSIKMLVTPNVETYIKRGRLYED
ncbi:nicotinate (nicotinamide) nucleotide adenylyltransferase [Mammaliicoccus stepanovicii]|uniref:Probable nicotinate-nucleotide adenylyltransferase n=1 Tax=Mammaliicoccus stepanovicii TaxID=643214 RepID=A0A239Z435_9STAP|nr:nicotinate (nicotinamide) nucleotide adenylyltransferase [Mammaliicoccus stepanovicii]PNZ72432.1 nicotinate (nicotinamide) nucleotide adenylyltransferase [Mammaliicoccus stepanovicii]GGI40131.1 putative nicotinate-nucleotide adenylyltransferase [Mammaliicoccus stepanovicii]SNV65875.1 Nicotinate-nucleotide adenylyltransferase, bacterial NadD family [Mammaliicoccus stepanovicii]